MHESLKRIFTIANRSLSIYNEEDIKKILYKNGRNNVSNAAFSSEKRFKHLSVERLIPALDLLARELYLYISNRNIETQSSYNTWHHQVAEKFLSKLNESGLDFKYGKAQKCINVAMKYLYCFSDASTCFEYKKFNFCHIALDGYTYYGASSRSYPMSFYRDYVYPFIYNETPNFLPCWSNLNYLGDNGYLSILNNINEYFNTHHNTFNDYLRICHSMNILLDINELANEENRVLTSFEAEFFLWAISKKMAKDKTSFIIDIL